MPYIDENGKTDAEKYLEGCLDGTYVVGRRIIALAEMMLPQIRNGYKKWRYDPAYATRVVEWIETFCMLPSGKLGVPFILEPYERMILELIFGFVDEDGNRRFKEALVEIGRKNGKGVALDEKLPTPNGWRKMGDLHVGDVVFGQDGTPSTIIAESEIFDKPTYRITFEDGASFKVTDDHIWTVQTKRSRRCAKDYLPGKTNQVKNRKYREGGWFETTTQEMFDDPFFVTQRKDGKGVEYKYRVPMNMPVEYPEKDLPVDPYTLGYWIGDGSKGYSTVTVDWNDLEEAIANIEANGHVCNVFKRNGEKAATVNIDANTCEGKHSNAFLNNMREIGVLNNKHIPDMYLQGSIDQRIELLCGLMDTDGYVSKAGQCQFIQKNEAIVDQFVELCSSLGIKANKSSKIARCNGKPAGRVYMVEFWTDKDHSCFHLSRKHNRLKDKLAPRMSCKSIVKIERIPNEPTKCIAIDNPSHLYLVGHQYTATHNTAICAALNLYMLTSDGEGAPQCINAAVNEQQASLCFGATWSMVRQSPKLAKYVKKGVVPDRKTTGLKFAPNLGYLVTVSSRSDALDGLNVHYAVLDELGGSRDRSTYDLMKGSTGAQDQPLIFIISTQNYIRDNIWDIQRDYAVRWLDATIEDDEFIGILYEMDDRSEIYNEAMWPKANPGLGTVKKWDYMRSEMKKAENDPSYLNQVLIKQFNLPANQSTAYFSYDEAVNETMYDFDPRVFRYCVVGFDAADTLDLNAATALFMKPGDNHIYRRSMYWIAEEQVKVNTTSMRGRDGVPYELWASRGLIRIVPGNKVDRRVFLDWIQELADEGLYTRYVGYDPWHMDVIVPELKMMVGDENVEVVRQGVQTLSQPMKQLKADLRDKRIINNHNPIDEWTILNVAAKIDINDNVQPVKKGSATTRIDGFMALLDAYITLQRHEQDYLQIIGWDKGL